MLSWERWYQHQAWSEQVTNITVPTKISKRVKTQAACLYFHMQACSSTGKDIHFARNSTADAAILSLHRRANAAKHDQLLRDPWWSKNLSYPWQTAYTPKAARPATALPVVCTDAWCDHKAVGNSHPAQVQEGDKIASHGGGAKAEPPSIVHDGFSLSHSGLDLHVELPI